MKLELLTDTFAILFFQVELDLPIEVKAGYVGRYFLIFINFSGPAGTITFCTRSFMH